MFNYVYTAAFATCRYTEVIHIPSCMPILMLALWLRDVICTFGLF